MAPPLSIVTPCLNAAATISRTLESVESNGVYGVEHIVVDGGSTDGTLEILARYPDIRVVSEPDDGLADAFNKGAAMATGDVVGWLNADDWYLPGALEAVVAAARSDPGAEWFTGGCPIVDGSGREVRRAVTAYKKFLLRRYSLRLYLTQNFVSCPATFVRRDALVEVCPLPLTYRYSVDYELFLRLARRGDPVVLDRDLAVFVMEEGTLSMTGFEQQFAEHASQARIHGAGHPFAVTVNSAVSRAIVLVYRFLRRVRRAA